MKKALFFLQLLTVVLLLPLPSPAAIIGYWRMEADADAGAGVNVANEVAGNALVVAAGSISGTVPANPVPQTGAANVGSLNGSTDINGTVAAYAALNVSSFTFELFERSQEATATLASRGNGTSTTRGFTFFNNLNTLTVTYATDDGAGGVTSNVLNIGDVNNTTAWHHIAFTFDAATGVGNAYLDGVLTQTKDGPDGLGMLWTAATALSLGTQMDGGGISSGSTEGIMDEVRLSDTALLPSQFLNVVPEPHSALLVLCGAMALLGRRRVPRQVRQAPSRRGFTASSASSSDRRHPRASGQPFPR
jgi:hypothetical protein